MSKVIELDSIDKEIISILQSDSTKSIQFIAEQVGLSNNPCWRRIKRLEDEGLIERRVAIINPRVIGLGTTAFVSIKIDQHEGGWLEKFATCVEQIPEIVECHRMAGEVDYLLKIIVRDLEHYDRVYRRMINDIPGLSDVSSTFSMEQLKHRTAIDVASLVS
ncbi:MAG: Lrp/AsnC family transcriptional regulator [Pseudomonadota bacterium]